jgi:hypothetical protein
VYGFTTKNESNLAEPRADCLYAEPPYQQQDNDTTDGKFNPSLDTQRIEFWMNGEFPHAQPRIATLL